MGEKHPNSLKLQKVPKEEFEKVFDYGLKDITKSDDINQVVDWAKSSFYKQTLRTQIKARYDNQISGFFRLGSEYKNNPIALSTK